MKKIILLLVTISLVCLTSCNVFKDYYYFSGSYIYDTIYNYSEKQLDSACLLMMYKHPELEVPDSAINSAKLKFPDYKYKHEQLDLYKKTKKFYQFLGDKEIKPIYLCYSSTYKYYFYFSVSPTSQLYLLYIKTNDFNSKVVYRESMTSKEAKFIQTIFYNEILTKIDTILKVMQ